MIGIKEDHSDSCSTRLGGCWHPCLHCPQKGCWRPILPQHQLDLWVRVKHKLKSLEPPELICLIRQPKLQTEKSSGTSCWDYGQDRIESLVPKVSSAPHHLLCRPKKETSEGQTDQSQGILMFSYHTSCVPSYTPGISTPVEYDCSDLRLPAASFSSTPKDRSGVPNRFSDSLNRCQSQRFF